MRAAACLVLAVCVAVAVARYGEPPTGRTYNRAPPRPQPRPRSYQPRTPQHWGPERRPAARPAEKESGPAKAYFTRYRALEEAGLRADLQRREQRIQADEGRLSYDRSQQRNLDRPKQQPQQQHHHSCGFLGLGCAVHAVAHVADDALHGVAKAGAWAEHGVVRTADVALKDPLTMLNPFTSLHSKFTALNDVMNYAGGIGTGVNRVMSDAFGAVGKGVKFAGSELDKTPMGRAITRGVMDIPGVKAADKFFHSPNFITGAMKDVTHGIGSANNWIANQYATLGTHVGVSRKASLHAFKNGETGAIAAAEMVPVARGIGTGLRAAGQVAEATGQRLLSKDAMYAAWRQAGHETVRSVIRPDDGVKDPLKEGFKSVASKVYETDRVQGWKDALKQWGQRLNANTQHWGSDSLRQGLKKAWEGGTERARSASDLLGSERGQWALDGYAAYKLAKEKSDTPDIERAFGGGGGEKRPSQRQAYQQDMRSHEQDAQQQQQQVAAEEAALQMLQQAPPNY